jgi:SP family xylose:H+ symportor-like MFS transporter
MSGPGHRRTPEAGIVASSSGETLKIPTDQNLYLWAISFVAALGGLLFGYDWVVIGGAKPFYEKFFHLTDVAQQGWAMSCALIGCLLGAVISGSLSYS